MKSMIMSPYKIFFLLFIGSNVRHELCPFYPSEAARVPPTNTTAARVPPTNTTASQGKGGISWGTIVAIVVPVSVVVLIFIVGICCLSKRIRKKIDSALKEKSAYISNLDSLQYDFPTIEAATNEFSADNKLGKGGFGDVYKGMLPSGREIAVKRLSRRSSQGVDEFKNEVEVLTKLKHRNLVELIGFCLQGEEKILVYEYVPNRSLDIILFGQLEKQQKLDWTMPYKIVKGIARGIQYLHDDSRLRIIHRDLKLNNILLDNNMNPKISNFGLAKIFTVDQTQGNTHRIIGTYGYASPEYMMHGEFSIKSDVYSFGILLMEIISGKRNHSFCQMEGADDDLLSYAWKLWKDGEPLKLLDPTIRESYNANEVMRCIHIGLLCVQEDPADRPSMSSILVMLEGYTMALPTPSQPAFSTY